MERILIYGLGLMGGSIALAIRKHMPQVSVDGLVKDAVEQEQAQALHIAHRIETELEFLQQNRWQDYQLIIFCLPVHLICQKIATIPPDYRGIITDIGSSKKEIIEAVECHFAHQKHHYYSSHPMAGSEHTGCQYAIDDLFTDKLCIMTPAKGMQASIADQLVQFWQTLGMQTVEIAAEAHDEVLAYLSHSPHIISALLVNWSQENEQVDKYSQKSPLPLTGGGFRDMSRIAGSNPEMWHAIITSNQKSIHKSLVEFQRHLSQVIHALEIDPATDYWQVFFSQAQKKRNTLLKLGNNPSNN